MNEQPAMGTLELPRDVALATASWSRILSRAATEHRAKLFERSAVELWRLARIYPDRDDVSQEIRAALDAMAQETELSPDEVQAIIADGFEAPPDVRPGSRLRVADAVRSTHDGPTKEPMNGRSFEEPPAPAGPEDYGLGDARPPESLHPPATVTFTTPSDWPDEPPPPVEWVAHHRIPRGDVTTLHGDGGAGKTDVALQLATACGRGRDDWLGHVIAPGPAVFLSAEEPETEIRRRLWRHGERDGFDHRAAKVFFWFPDDIAGAALATPDPRGVMRPTPTFAALEAQIIDLRPVLVVVDNVAAIFAGNQNDRVMVRSFVNLWRGLAHRSGAAVLLLDHPSLSGMTNGTGRGGNMDWRNAVRSALYLRPAPDQVDADRGVRILETVKNNYGPVGNPIRLQWTAGGLALEGSTDVFRRAAQDQEADDTFLQLLDERNRLGLPASPLKGRNYAPTLFAEMQDNGGYTGKVFAQAMDRLLKAGKLTVVTDGSPSRQIKRLVRPDRARSPSTAP